MVSTRSHTQSSPWRSRWRIRSRVRSDKARNILSTAGCCDLSFIRLREYSRGGRPVQIPRDELVVLTAAVVVAIHRFVGMQDGQGLAVGAEADDILLDLKTRWPSSPHAGRSSTSPPQAAL